MAYLDEAGLEALWGDIEELVDGVTISDGGVTTAKLADGAVTDDKLAQSGGILEKVDELKSSISETTRNLFSGISVFSNCKLENNNVTNTNTDSKTKLQLQVLFRNGTTIVSGSNLRNINTTGRQIFTVTPSGDGNNIFIKHNGSTRDISITIPLNFTQQTYTVSINVEGYNPAVVGGMVISQIQVETGSTATAYISHVTAVDYAARESIESAYTELSGDVESIESNVESVEAAILAISDSLDAKKSYLFGFSNGSPQNQSNTWLVTSDYIPITNYEKITVLIHNRKNINGCHYAYGFALYDANKTLISYTDIATTYTSNERIAESSRKISYVKVCVGEYDTNGNHTTLRKSDFAVEGAYIINQYDMLLSRLNTKNGLIKSTQCSASKSFIFFSDIHGAVTNMRRIVAIANHISNIDAVINGGDTVTSVLADMTWYNDIVDTCTTDVLICIGNHDAWEGTPGTAATKQSIYNAQIAPMVSKVSNIVQPVDVEQNYECYYYKDYGNIRLIVLDAMTGYAGIAHYDTAQDTWLTNVLVDAIANDKTVLAVNHTPFAQNDTNRDNSLNWNSWKSYLTSDTMAIAEGALDCIDTFINNGGKFACWLTGHKHFDNVISSINHPNQFMFNTATANFYNHNIDGVFANDLFSELYDCATMLSIDTTHAMIKFMRIGYVIDGGMRHRETLCYNYNTHEIIAH